MKMKVIKALMMPLLSKKNPIRICFKRNEKRRDLKLVKRKETN